MYFRLHYVQNTFKAFRVVLVLYTVNTYFGTRALRAIECHGLQGVKIAKGRAMCNCSDSDPWRAWKSDHGAGCGFYIIYVTRVRSLGVHLKDYTRKKYFIFLFVFGFLYFIYSIKVCSWSRKKMIRYAQRRQGRFTLYYAVCPVLCFLAPISNAVPMDFDKVIGFNNNEKKKIIIM